MKKFLLFVSLSLFVVCVNAKDPIKRVKGVIVTETGEPIPRVVVYVDGKEKLTMTNANGEFVFSKLTTDDSLLVIIPKLGMTKVACTIEEMRIVIDKNRFVGADDELRDTIYVTLRDHLISGLVRVNESDEPVPHATILVSDIDDKIVGHGASDSIGYFNMKVHGTGDYTLKISSVGYSDNYKGVRFSPEDSVANVGIIKMFEGVQLKEVEVKDKRAEKGKRVYSNIMTRSDIESSGARDIYTLIRSNFAGVYVSVSNVEARARFRVRGAASIRLDNEPLVILDDVRVCPADDEKAMEIIYNTVPMDIIESVEVNKTGAGYGSLGANGVIIIKTIRGKSR